MEDDIFERLGKVNYVPVIGGPFIGYATNDKFIVNGKRITPITKDSLLPCKSYLINPYHSFNDFPGVVEKNLLNDDRIVFADSGGLQEINLQLKKFDHIEIFKWQEKYSNIGFCYDVIPFKSDEGARFTGWVFDGKRFEECANMTLNNMNDVNKIRTEFKKFKFYGIIQGRNKEEYTRWYNIVKVANPDGYCVKTPNNNPISLAETCCFAYDNLTTPIHFLGVGNITKSALLVYFSNFYKNKISFDSSSYDLGTRYRTYLVPSSITAKIQINKINPVDSLDFCNCSVCSNVSKYCDVKKLLEDDDPTIGPIISLHNLGYMVKLIRYLELCGKDRDKYFDLLSNLKNDLDFKKLNTAFDIIDDLVSKGGEYVESKYKNIFNQSQNEDISKQNSLF